MSDNQIRLALQSLARKAGGFANDTTPALPSVAFPSSTDGADCASNYIHIIYELARELDKVISSCAAAVECNDKDLVHFVENAIHDNVDFAIKQAGDVLDERSGPDPDWLRDERVARELERM